MAPISSTGTGAPGAGPARLLALAQRLPRPDESSGASRFLAMLTQLARQTSVQLWVEEDETHGSSPLPASRVAADRQHLADAGVAVLPCTFLALREALAADGQVTVLFEAYPMASRYLRLVEARRPDATLIIDSVDVHFARLTAGVAVGAVPGRVAERVRRDETASYRSADAIVVVSSDDAGVLRGEPGMPPMICVPNSVTMQPRAERTRRPEAIFVGHFHHAPNLDGLEWLVREIWPRVLAQRPEARLTIIGSHASAAVYDLGRTSGVEVLGHVTDLQPHLDRAMAAIAPLRYGAGMKGKVTNAMAAGIPVVTTTVGAQGLGIVDGRQAYIADEPEAFADALIKMFDDPERAAMIGLAGQRHIAGLCGPDALAASLGALLAVRPTGGRAPSSATRASLTLARAAVRYWWVSALRRYAGWLAPQRPGLLGRTDQLASARRR